MHVLYKFLLNPIYILLYAGDSLFVGVTGFELGFVEVGKVGMIEPSEAADPVLW